MDFRRANFSLFRDFLGRIQWEQVLRKEKYKTWLLFKDHVLQAQEQCIPMSKKLGKEVKERSSCVNKELLSILKQKQKIHRRWKQG